MTPYEQLLSVIADETASSVVTIVQQIGAGVLSQAEGVELIVALIGEGSSMATAVADAVLAAQLSAEVGAVVPPAGLLHVPDTVKLADVVGALLAEAATDERFWRLAQGAVTYAGADASTTAMRDSIAEGWVRDLDSKACQLCRWWWREGRVWPKDHRMPRHTGCVCSPRPVVAENIRDTYMTRIA